MERSEKSEARMRTFAEGCPLLFAASNKLLVDLRQRPGDAPARIVAAEFLHVADVADVVALAVLLDVAALDLFAGQRLGGVHRFKHRTTVAAATAQVVHL